MPLTDDGHLPRLKGEYTFPGSRLSEQTATTPDRIPSDLDQAVSFPAGTLPATIWETRGGVRRQVGR